MITITRLDKRKYKTCIGRTWNKIFLINPVDFQPSKVIFTLKVPPKVFPSLQSNDMSNNVDSYSMCPYHKARLQPKEEWTSTLIPVLIPFPLALAFHREHYLSSCQAHLHVSNFGLLSTYKLSLPNPKKRYIICNFWKTMKKLHKIAPVDIFYIKNWFKYFVLNRS